LIAQLSGGAIIGPGAFVVALVILAAFGRSARRVDRGLSDRQVRRSVREWERLRDVLP
jgi:hypothetical protein